MHPIQLASSGRICLQASSPEPHARTVLNFLMANLLVALSLNSISSGAAHDKRQEGSLSAGGFHWPPHLSCTAGRVEWVSSLPLVYHTSDALIGTNALDLAILLENFG